MLLHRPPNNFSTLCANLSLTFLAFPCGGVDGSQEGPTRGARTVKTPPWRRGKFRIFSLNPCQLVRWEFKGSKLGETGDLFGAMCAIWESLLWHGARGPIVESINMD